jgi:hypothetical protein
MHTIESKDGRLGYVVGPGEMNFLLGSMALNLFISNGEKRPVFGKRGGLLHTVITPTTGRGEEFMAKALLRSEKRLPAQRVFNRLGFR